jgi:formylglycine-generating enzyme required for sulfatase activity
MLSANRRTALALVLTFGAWATGHTRPTRPAPAVFRDCALCPEMVSLPAGTYRMGSPTSETGWDNNEGLRNGVRVTAFAIGRAEVTVAQYMACVGAGACGEPHWKEAGAQALFGDLGASVSQPDHPITGVSWDMAQRYVRWLSQHTGARYSLPSETQWEYAARAQTSTRWSFGDNPALANAFAWNEGNSGRLLRPVGTRKPNAFGLHDMHGSVWEWVQDCYEVWDVYDHWDPRFGKAPLDEKAWEQGPCNNRVMRGGSWHDEVERLRSAVRAYNNHGHATPILGIRVAREPNARKR